MNTCLCGTSIEGESTRCPRCIALHVLGLNIDATEKEIRHIYRTLVKVRHPFPGEHNAKEDEETKLKIINSAFEFLTSTSWERARQQPSSYAFMKAAAQELQQAAKPDSTGGTTPVVVSLTNHHRSLQHKTTLFSKLRQLRSSFSWADTD